MATVNTFKSYFKQANGASAVEIIPDLATVTNTVIGLSVANTDTETITASVYIDRTGDVNSPFYLVKGATIPVGSSLVVIGGDQKLVLEPTDTLSFLTAAGFTASAVVSVLEQVIT